MKGPKNQLARKSGPPPMHVRDWFTEPDCDLVARRRDVWGLLGWYHRKIVAPQLGLRGFLRRLWWRLTRDPRLVSPWDQLERRKALALKLAEERRARATDNGGP